VHWTYAKPETSDLSQGDILLPETELRENVLRRVHPYFAHQKYLAFMVTTQSCDLVLRDGKPSASHISIAPVRSLKAVWLKITKTLRCHMGGRFFDGKGKEQARQLLDRIVDQNETSLGLFYLHPDGEVGIGDPAVAYLRLGVALRASHYGVLLDARTASLTHEFRAKFGWLLGNLYSRAAARDWADDIADKQKIRDLKRGFVEGKYVDEPPVWVDAHKAKAAKAAEIDFDRDVTDVEADIKNLYAKRRFEEVVDRTMVRIQEVLQPPDDQKDELRRRLAKDVTLRSLIPD
jgi:hypothetical protein